MIVGVGSLHYSIIKMYATSSIFKEVLLHQVSLEMFDLAICVRWPILPNIKSSCHTLKHHLERLLLIICVRTAPFKNPQKHMSFPKGSAIRTCEISVSEDAPWEVLHVQKKRRSTSDLRASLKHILVLLQPPLPNEFILSLTVNVKWFFMSKNTRGLRCSLS